MIFRNMPFSDYLAAPGINSSAIKAGTKSMLDMHHSLTGPKGESSEAQTRGTMIHSMLLEPDLFHESLALWEGRPLKSGPRKGEISLDRRGSEWDEFVSANAGRQIVTTEDLEFLDKIRDAVNADLMSSITLGGTECELSLFWDSSSIGQCKARFDAIKSNETTETKCIIDIKTTADAARFERDVWRYRYDIQAAHYLSGARANDIQADSFAWIVIQTVPPIYAFTVFAGPDVIAAANREIERIVTKYRECEKVGRYPHAFDGVNEINLPDRMLTDEVIFDA